MSKPPAFAALLAVAFFPLTAKADLMVGSLTTADGGIVATDGWSSNANGFVISWNITFSGGLWHYEYTFTSVGGGAPNPDISHWILEVSDTFTANDIRNANAPSVVGPQTFTADPNSPNSTSPGANNGNPNLPADIFGIKLEDETQALSFFEFDSTRAPIWGSFYAKDGRQGGVVATAWNSGLTDPDGAFIAVPDTTTIATPEPASLALLGMAGGCYGLFALARRRRQRICNS